MSNEECNHPPLMGTPVTAGFPSPAEQYIESPLDLNELLVHRPAATFFCPCGGRFHAQCRNPARRYSGC